MRRKNQQPNNDRARTDRSHMDSLLNDGLEQTFPASDPVAVYVEECARPQPATPSSHARGPLKITIGRPL
jgi:hypothetical protein